MPVDAGLLSALRIAGPVVLLVCAWAVWERRVTFGSRFDFSATASLAFFGIGSALDSPWPQIAAASHPLIGKYYALNLIAHLCYLAGSALCVRAIYLRLMPDGAIGPFMRRRIAPLAIGAGAVMLCSFAASAATSTMSGDHLYLVTPDGWVKVYWLAHFGTATLLGVVAVYGVYLLRPDPRAVLLNVVMAALAVGAVMGGVVVGWGVITGRIETSRLVAWLLTYAAFAATAVVSAVQLHRRVQALHLPRTDHQPRP